MDGSARASAAMEASGAAPLVSPPPIDAEDPSPSSTSSMPTSTSTVGPVQTSQVAYPSSSDSKSKGSPARLTEASVAQHGEQQPSEHPMTPETASSGSSHRSGSDGAPTPSTSEKGGDQTRNNESKEANSELQSGRSDGQQMQLSVESKGPVNGEVLAATAAPAAPGPTKKLKQWFEVIPVVLQNFKNHNQEQIKQLALPQCMVCGLRGKVQRAEFRCQQEKCKLVSRPLCGSCWETSHGTDEKKQHRQLLTTICQQCQLDRVAFWCAECDLKFCQSCFDLIHSVAKTKIHRRLATEDVPGSCLVKSHWSESFQNAILKMIAVRKHPPPVSDGSGGESIGEKRKREIEVIVIDDDEDTNGVSAQSSHPVRIGVSEQTPITQNGTNSVSNALARSNAVLSHLSVAAGTFSQPEIAQNSMIEPIPFPRELTETTPASLPSSTGFGSAQTSFSVSASMTPNGNNTVNINTSTGNAQWNNGTTQFSASAPVGSASSVMSNGMMEVTPISVPGSVSMANGVWSTNSAISTDLASTSTSGNLLPLGGAVFAENALVDSLIDRYHEMNQNVTNMELQSEQLTRQIAVATCQGPYAAVPLMDMLNRLQPILVEVRVRRDKFLVAMIIQSHDIMAAVRLLRLSELGDVPQVPMISHRKCLQISNEINQHKKKLLELNQKLSETLNQSHAVSSIWANTLIRTTSTNIQMHERNIKTLKKDREVEIVRIVQFSKDIRESLKLAFQHTVELQRQREQAQQRQQQQQQQFQPFG